MNKYDISPLYKEHSCSCDKCKSMCKKQACIGTPEEMLRIAKAGYADKLAKTSWLVGVIVGTHKKGVDIVAPNMTKDGCPFLDKNNLCILHNLGLKPLEGRMTNNHEPIVLKSIEDGLKSPVFVAVAEWEKINYNGIIRRIFRKTAKD